MGGLFLGIINRKSTSVIVEGGWDLILHVKVGINPNHLIEFSSKIV